MNLALLLNQPVSLHGNEVVYSGPSAVARVEGMDQVVNVQVSRELKVCEGPIGNRPRSAMSSHST
jgi:hypothetical protein